MMGAYDLTFKRGDTVQWAVDWKHDGDLVDLTGYTARLHLRRNVQDSEPVVSLTHSAGLSLGGSSGRTIVTITDVAAATLSGRYLWDLELVSQSGTKTTIPPGETVGTITFPLDITHD